MNKRAPINRGHFRNWLNRHKPHQVVGTSGQERNCPLACYVKQKLQTNAVSIGDPEGLDEVCKIQGKQYALPKWCTEFMFQVDRDGTGANITARRARWILDDVESRLRVAGHIRR